MRKILKKRWIALLLAVLLAVSVPFAGSAASPVLGDADGSGTVEIADAIAVLRYTAGMRESVAAGADLDGNGTVNIADAVLLLRRIIGEEPDIQFSGFAIDFDADTDYYLCNPVDFQNCRIESYTGFESITVKVEQYAGYYPYSTAAYQLGDALKLGNGRAKLVITATLKDGTKKEYLIALTDPDGAEYCYAKTTADVPLRKEPGTSAQSLGTIAAGTRVYYLQTVGEWWMVEQLNTGVVGYIQGDHLRREWNQAEVPARYAEAIEALQKTHPDWTFEYLDTEMTYAEALAAYGTANEQYIDPYHYLTEEKIFALLDIDTYNASWKDAGISAIWTDETAITKAEAADYFMAAAGSLQVNPYYMAARAALQTNYGTDAMAKGTVTGYEGYYNVLNISTGASYAKARNWNSVKRSIVEGANWLKDQYLDQGAHTPYFFRFAGFQSKSLGSVDTPLKEGALLKKAYADGAAHFIIPVYREYPYQPAVPDNGPTVSFSGFDIDFDVDTDYYLCSPADFSACSVVGYSGFTSIAVSVEQYASYYPYANTAYQLGTPLKLGNGRAKVTITATLEDGSTKEYLIALTDPEGAEYSYARARVSGTVNLRAEPSSSSQSLAQLSNNTRVYYLETVGDWCKVERLERGIVGYIHKNYLRWEWLATSMPARYKTAIEALQKAHPNWTFEFVDVEMTYAEALETYGSANETYIDPLNYLTEDKIFAMLDIDTYDPATWNDAGIAAIWANESAITKADAVSYFNAASKSLLMNPYYIACRAALESGYGTSKFAKGTVTGYEGYYNFFGIQCYDSNPSVGAAYAKNRNWNSVFRSIVEGANWVKDQYLDQGAQTPYFFRYAGFQNKVYMSDVQAPLKEANILKRAFTDAKAKAHFIIPVSEARP